MLAVLSSATRVMTCRPGWAEGTWSASCSVSLLTPFLAVQTETMASFWVSVVWQLARGVTPTRKERYGDRGNRSYLSGGVCVCLPTSPSLGLLWFTLSLFRGPELQGQTWCTRNGLGMESHPPPGTSRSQPTWKGFPLPCSVGSHTEDTALHPQ